MRKIWPIILVAIIIVLVSFSAYLIGQNQGLMKDRAAKTEPTPTSGTAPETGEMMEETTPNPTNGPTPTPKQAVVIIESESNLPSQDVSELKSRVINPYVDYNAEAMPYPVVSLKVSKNTGGMQDVYPYQAEAIFTNGGNEGFLIQKNSGHINWWYPGCINGCTFSDAFKAKYPEVVAQGQ